MSVGEFTASNIAVDQDEQELKGPKKGTVDYTKLDADIAATKGLAKSNFAGALDGLLNIEKQQRLGEDITGTKRACAAILDLLLEAGKWKELNEHILLLSKRRGQLKQVVQDMVRQAMGAVDRTPDKETRVELIKTLQAVTEGKIYVEIERARLSKALAKIREDEGNIDAAAEILQEVAVETFGAMAKTEKIAFILQQVRLCLERKDYVRAQILSRKISPRAFKEAKKGTEAGEVGIEGTTIQQPEPGTPSLRDLKLAYYQLQIRYHAHSRAYLDICRCYRAMYEDEAIAGDRALWEPILKKICWYVVLAPASSDQVTLLSLTAADRKLAQLPEYAELLALFTTQEIAWWWKLEERYAAEMAAQAEVFGPEAGGEARTDLQARVTEHNILVVAKYYSQLRLARLATLLDLPEDKTEEALSELVVSKAVSAKIDRLSGIVRFAGPQSASAVLNTWAASIGKLLDVVERSCQQIQKESMVHRVPIGSK